MEAAEIEASCRARGVDFREVLGVYRATPAESLAEALEIVLRRPSALER